MTLMFLNGMMYARADRPRWWVNSITNPVTTSSGPYHAEPSMNRVLYWGDDNIVRIGWHTIPDMYEEVFCGFRMRFPTNNLENRSLANWVNRHGDRHCSLHAIWDASTSNYYFVVRDYTSNLQIGGGGDTARFYEDRWYYIEWKVLFSTGTGGSTSLRIDGRLIGEWTGISTMVGTAPQYAAKLELGANSSKWGNIGGRMDDLYIANSSGDYNNDFLGDIFVEQIIPIGKGKEGDNMKGSDGNRVNNYSLIDDRTSMGSDYLRASGVEEVELFDMKEPEFGSDDIKGVQLFANGSKFGVNNISGTFLFGQNKGNSIVTGANFNIGEQNYDHFEVIETNPTTNEPWEQKALRDTQLGIKIGYLSSGTR